MASSIRSKIENREMVGYVVINDHMKMTDIRFSVDFPYALTSFVTINGSVTLLTMEEAIDVIGFLEIVEHHAVLL